MENYKKTADRQRQWQRRKKVEEKDKKKTHMCHPPLTRLTFLQSSVLPPTHTPYFLSGFTGPMPDALSHLKELRGLQLNGSLLLVVVVVVVEVAVEVGVFVPPAFDSFHVFYLLPLLLLLMLKLQKQKTSAPLSPSSLLL